MRAGLTLGRAAFILAFCLALFAPKVFAASLEEIRARGEIIIGVKDASPPFGFRNSEAVLSGLEVDLANDLASRLGVKLTLFPVSATSRLQFLDLGMVDLVLATLAVTPERQRHAELVEPYYYASTPTFFVANSASVNAPKDLQGKSLCVIQGAYYLGDLAARMAGSELILFKSGEQAAAGLQKNRCAALVGMDVQLLHWKKTRADLWSDYNLVPSGLPPLAWAVAVKPSDQSAELRRILAETVTDWHRSGKLIELERKWLGENTGWLSMMHEKFKADLDGG